jgi:transposase
MEVAMRTDLTCGPENCPLTAWTALSPSERKAQRQPLARKLYEQGFTEQQIADQFGVSQKTISEDLENYTKGINQKRTKTASNPKGAGRPKGSIRPRKNESVSAETAATQILDWAP